MFREIDFEYAYFEMGAKVRTFRDTDPDLEPDTDPGPFSQLI
jgi:hypothetical protein